MKSAIYIQDGVLQFVITPENEYEKAIVNNLEGKEIRTEVRHGSFYKCQGGWHRENGDRSLIVSIEKDRSEDQSVGPFRGRQDVPVGVMGWAVKVVSDCAILEAVPNGEYERGYHDCGLKIIEELKKIGKSS